MTDLLARLRIEASAGTLPAVAGQVENRMDRIQASARRASGGLTSTAAASTAAASGMSRATAEAQRLEGGLGGVANGAGRLRTLLAGVGLGVFVNDVTNAAFAAGGLEMGLGAVAGGAAGAQAELAFVEAEAHRLGLVAQTSAQSLLGLAAATNETELAGQATREIWLSTAEAGMALGRTPAQINNGLVALQQIASKGVVSMEELRQQLAEAVPGAVQIAARAMNMSTAELSKMVAEGDLLATDFLPKFAAQLREEYGPAIEAYMTTPLGLARREIGELGTDLNKLRASTGAGFLEGATAGLDRLNDSLDGDAADRARDIGLALGEGAALAAQGIALTVDHADELILAAQALAGVGLTKFLVSTAQAAAQAAAALAIKGGAARLASAEAAAGLSAEAAAAQAAENRLRPLLAAEVARAEAAVAAANASRASALALHAQAQAALAAGGQARTLAARQVVATEAMAALKLATDQAAAAQARLAAAQGVAAAASTNAGAAMMLARGAASGLLSLMGGPWGAAMLGAGAAAWVVAEGVKAQEEEVQRAAETWTNANRALDEAEAYLREAADGSKTFGEESGSAVKPTDDLAGATGRLAAQTWELANARAAAASRALQDSRDELEEERRRAQGALDRATYPSTRENAERTTYVSAPVGVNADGSPMMGRVLAVDRIAQIDQERAAMARQQQEIILDPRSHQPEGGGGGGGGGTSSGDKKKRDRVADTIADLEAEARALAGHALAAGQGEAALDAWRIAQAGADAVLRAGLEPGDARADQVRDLAEETERLAIADERIEAAWSGARADRDETEALRRRAAAALLGSQALEELRIEEARLAVLDAARVDSLDALTGLEREAVAARLASAEARERQAIATEKAERAGARVEDLNDQIAAEERRAAAIAGGVAAAVEYARAEFVRQEVERAGLEIDDASAEAIRERAAALFKAQAATDGLQRAYDQERELRLMRLSNREREIAVRAEEWLTQLLTERADLTVEQAEAEAARRARAEIEAAETNAAIGRISSSMRDSFVRDGRLAFDDLGAYAEERLRAALYDAFLAEPIDLVIRATVDIVNDLAGQIFGGSAAKGFLQTLLGGWSSVLAGAGVGGALGSALGLSSGNTLADIGLSAGGSYLGGLLGSSLGLTGALGSVMGPLGALAGLALGSLFGDDKRPYTRADIVAQGGQFVVAGTDTADGGDASVAAALGKAITESLNNAASLFGLDVAALEGLYTTAGYVSGGNYKALGGEGYFGGDIQGAIDYYNQAGRDLKGNTLGAGVTFTEISTAEELAEAVVKETILRAIAAGASDLTDAEASLVAAASSLEEAISLITAARGIGERVDDMLLQLLDPAAFERKKALAAVEATYEALRKEAEALIDAGLISADILLKIEELRRLQREAALADLTADPFVAARDRLQSWLDGLAVSDLAPTDPAGQRAEALAQYERILAAAQAGDEDALSELTTYAERLLRADVEATGSAADRAALYDRVTAEIRELVGRGAEPLTPGAINGPIIEALAASQTALAAVIGSLPAETAAPLIAAILAEPDWAARLLGENAQVPPALAELVEQVRASADGGASIVEAVLATPEWTKAVTLRLAEITPSLETVRLALAGLPEETAGPIVAALASEPTWAAALTDAIGEGLTYSLDELTAVLRRLLGLSDQGLDPLVLPGWTGPGNEGAGGGSDTGGGGALDWPPPGWEDFFKPFDPGDIGGDVGGFQSVTPLEDVTVALTRELREVVKAVEDGFDRLSEDQGEALAALAEITAAGLDAVKGAGEESARALRDLATSQRLTAAQALARAS